MRYLKTCDVARFTWASVYVIVFTLFSSLGGNKINTVDVRTSQTNRLFICTYSSIFMIFQLNSVNLVLLLPKLRQVSSYAKYGTIVKARVKKSKRFKVVNWESTVVKSQLFFLARSNSWSVQAKMWWTRRVFLGGGRWLSKLVERRLHPQ